MPATSPEAKARYKQYLRERREWYKEHGICVQCLTKWTAPGKTQCETCTKLIAERADLRDPGRVKRRTYNRERRKRLIAEGLCVNCGKRAALESQTRCHTCARKKRESEQVSRIRKRIEKRETKGE